MNRWGVAFTVGLTLGVLITFGYYWNGHRVSAEQRRHVTAYATTLTDKAHPVAYVDSEGGGFWRVIFIGGKCEVFDAKASGKPRPASTCSIG